MKKLLCIILASLMLIFSVSVTAFAKESDVPATDDFYNYYSKTYSSEKARIDAMTLAYEDDNFAMYLDNMTGETDELGLPLKSSGEFAILNKKTGEYTFSNPYDLNASGTSSNLLMKNAYMSQVLISYRDTLTKDEAYLSGFGSAASLGQISFKRISNGIRVEYAIGTVETKRLIPVWIEASRFNEKILDVLWEKYDDMTEKEQLTLRYMGDDTYYEYCNQADPTTPEARITIWRQAFTCLEKNHNMEIYALRDGTTERNRMDIEQLIRKYCPEYTYDDLEYDHSLTEYESSEREQPLFRLAVEYTFDSEGMTASIPAKSIRFNSTYYELREIVLLPYFGCVSLKQGGSVSHTGGYVFIPDGSGTLLEFYKNDGTINRSRQQTGIIYGQDNAKENIETAANIESAKVPVFGIVDEYSVTTTTTRTNRPAKTTIDTFTRGYTAIITAGEAFANIYGEIGKMNWSNLASISETDYATAYTTFTTTLSDEVSMGGTFGNEAAMSTTIDTKYTGNYAIKYVMLSDPATAKAAGVDYYEPSYIGMANVYRTYLIETGQIQKLTAEQAAAGVPLYIESFGSIKASSTFLTFPIMVTTPLTTFDDVKTMMQYFRFNGITNQRFVLTGFGNGTSQLQYYPTYVKWESKLGGKGGFEDLLAFAQRNGYTLFPQYDFMNIERYKGGFSMDKYAAKSMSGRYATLRLYNFVNQEYNRFGFKNLISASALETVYTKFSRQYNKYCVSALAMKTVGYQLDSNFDPDNPITREDAKEYVEGFLDSARADNEKLLISGGNSYTLKYATDIIELPLDNSGYAISSHSVPFIGTVLHGYMNYAGSASNMEGDSSYALLKALENGAGLYYILSYQNTDLIKTSLITKYYSMTFDTLAKNVVDFYNALSGAIGDLQDATITAHSFPTAYRMDSDVAAVFFGLSEKFVDDYKAATAAYNEAVDAVDELIKNNRDATAAVEVETKATEDFNATRTQTELSEKFVKRYNTGDVVSVTYTSPNGKSRTFYLNYNTYDVVVRTDDGKVFVVGAESFISSDDVEYVDEIVKECDAATAFRPRTTREKTTFDTYYGDLKAAQAEGNQALVESRIKTLNITVGQMVKVTSGVITAKTSSGRTVIFNYTSNNVIVKISDVDYREISSQSYIVIDG